MACLEADEEVLAMMKLRMIWLRRIVCTKHDREAGRRVYGGQWSAFVIQDEATGCWMRKRRRHGNDTENWSKEAVKAMI